MRGVSPPRCAIQRRTGDGIHRVQHLGGFGIGHRAAIGAEIPGRMEAEIGMRGHADLVMRNRAENDGAGRGAQAVDDDGLAGSAQALIFVDIGADPAAAIIGNPNHRMAAPTPASRRTAASNPVTNFMSQPQSKPSNPNLIVLSDARLRQRVAGSGFCPDGARRLKTNSN